jgi:hypothetical protein
MNEYYNNSWEFPVSMQNLKTNKDWKRGALFVKIKAGLRKI